MKPAAAAVAIASALAAGQAVADRQGTPAAAAGGLTGGPQIARAYDAIFDARFTEMPERLAATCPPGPAEVCQLLEVVALWWRIQLDPLDRSRDGVFRARADAAIGAIEAWTARDPERGEAWFYLGGAYGARAQWRVLRGDRLAAARDGRRIKEALERALALDPTLQDAWFGIGLYHYYADVAPAAFRMLRWLLLLPAGDRTAGLQEMLRARRGGEILGSEADYQLHLIYLWYEKQPARALELLRELDERHPRNPHFQQRIAEVEDVYFSDLAASRRSWQMLLEAAQAREVAEPAMAEAYARLGLARALARQGDVAAAVLHLRALIAARPEAPYGALAEAQVQLGRALDGLGERADAIEAYRGALAAVPPGDALDIEGRARAGVRAPQR